MTADHLAVYATLPAARAHLVFEHREGVLAHPVAVRTARGWTSADLHRHLHLHEHDHAFPTEEPA
jgi:hypothetical protein